MIKLVSPFPISALDKIMQGVESISGHYPSVDKLVSSMSVEDLGDLRGIIIVVGSNDLDSIGMYRNLSITLKRLYPECRLMFMYVNEEQFREIEKDLKELFPVFMSQQSMGKVGISMFEDMADRLLRDEEIGTDQPEVEEVSVSYSRSSLNKRIAVVDKTINGVGFHILNSINQMLSLNLSGAIGYFETEFSSGKIDKYLSGEGSNSLWDTYFTDKTFDVSASSFIKSNVFVAGATEGNGTKTLEYVRASTGFDFGFFDFGSSVERISTLVKVPEIDEVWVLANAGPESEEIDIKTLVGSNSVKVKVILCEVDEFSEYLITAEDKLSVLRPYIAHFLPNLNRNYLSKSLWEKKVMYSIREFQGVLGQLLSPLKMEVEKLCRD